MSKSQSEEQTTMEPLPRRAETDAWKRHRETEKYQSTETLASERSNIPWRREKMNTRWGDDKNKPWHEYRQHDKRVDERIENSKEDLYDPNPEEHNRAWQGGRSPRREVRYSTVVESRGNPFDDLRYSGVRTRLGAVPGFDTRFVNAGANGRAESRSRTNVRVATRVI